MYQSRSPWGSEGESNGHGVKNLRRSGSTTEHNAGNRSPKLDVSPSENEDSCSGVSYAQILRVSQEKFNAVIEIPRRPMS